MPRFHTLVLGGMESQSPVTPLPEFAREALLISLREKLITTPVNPIQMLLEPIGNEPLAVSFSMLSRGGAAVATWFRKITLRAGKVVGGSMDALSLVLSGEFLDRYALEAARDWRDAEGKQLPIDASWYRQVESAPKPLLANLCIAQDVSRDPAFLAASELLAQSFFELRERDQATAAASGSMSGRGEPAKRLVNIPQPKDLD